MHKILFQSSLHVDILISFFKAVTNDTYKMAKELQYFYLANGNFLR